MSATTEMRAFRLKRLVNLLAFLSGHPGVPVATVCAVFTMTTRELASAVNEILMCGVPPYTPSDYVNAWIEDDAVTVENAEFLRRPLSLTMAEAISIRVMVEDFMRHSPGVFEDAAETLCAKLNALLSGVRSPAGPGAGLGRKMAVLESALEESRAVEISYYSRAEDRLANRVVEPLAIVDIDGVWYLVAHCRLRGAERAFRIDRIRDAKPTGETFVRPADFNLADYRRDEMFFPTGAETPVRVRFAPGVARWAKERFAKHAAGKTPDGGLECEFPVADFAWISDLVIEFAGEARIVAPPEAQADFKRRLRDVLTLYDT